MNMQKFTVSAAHSLRLISISNVLAFGVVQSRAFIKSIGELEEMKIVPGTLTAEDGVNDGLYNKKYSFKLPGVSSNKTVYLENIKKDRYIALYVDEKGNERVSGSPDNPLSLSYEIKGGLYSCTLTGISTEPDAFI